ncbi:gamma-glutamyl-gamma-aminobutyrate hydrolase family protein [Psychrobacillus sp. NEAU-3TGS]|uniref:gamma-glutamyl-gamma-aminobutyrate hydrolase family protein n=1 Tax=Psychrobacillus sp. NEAU-3TGS TaxID=2995412 RepID=UPI002499A864|nr:gamma-glutamyl-gamma-aminobutyrate hydrolase family protein [Psychrobacillus sp. NEAU-3TGS]MDI2586843.1 gamma-glutamyl-gamma-aminobutyrate hydrolase family protein [Psychrobacillus sp. NEAU-3TGS]
MKPIIGITAEVKEDGNYFMPPVYGQAIIQAGGIPVLIPLIPEEDIEELAKQIDGLFVTGGEDIDPSYYNVEPHIHLGRITPMLDQMEFKLVQKMLELDKPYIGVCRGLHMLNVASGGTLYQSIHSQREEPVMQHAQKAIRTHRSHPVKVEKESQLYELLQQDELKVNSFHHQAVNVVGENLNVVARATDGIIECVESTKHHFVFGFQWHPEEFAVDGDEASKRVFHAYIQAALKRRNR